MNNIEDTFLDNKINFIEFGKIFTENGATDFQVLDHSFDKDQINKFQSTISNFAGQLIRSNHFNKVPSFSVAFVRLENSFIFFQMQYRQEGEYALSKNNLPEINRPYNQLRYSWISDKQADHYFRMGFRLFDTLLYKNPDENNLGQHPNALKDYIQPGSIQAPILLPSVNSYNAYLELPKDGMLVKNLICAIIKNWRDYKSDFKIILSNTDLNWKEQLELIELAQILVSPLIGCFTFLIGDIDVPKDKVNLRFLNGDINNRNFEGKIESLTSKTVNTQVYSEVVKLHQEYGSRFVLREFVELMRKCFFADIPMLHAGAIADLIFYEKYGLSESTRQNIEEIITSEKEICILSELDLYLLRKVIHRFIVQSEVEPRFRSRGFIEILRKCLYDMPPQHAWVIAKFLTDEIYQPTEIILRWVEEILASRDEIGILFKLGLIEYYLDFYMRQIHGGIEPTNMSKQFIEVLQACFFAGMPILHAWVIANLVSNRNYQPTGVSQQWLEEILASENEIRILDTLDLSKLIIDRLPIVNKISPSQASEFGHFLLEPSFNNRVNVLSSSMLYTQAVVISALERDPNHRSSGESAKWVLTESNSLRLLMQLSRGGLLEQFVKRTDFSELSISEKQKADDNLLLFSEIMNLISSDFPENEFLEIQEKCLVQMPILHSGIVAILLKLNKYKFSENGIRWSQEILTSAEEVRYLHNIGFYGKFIQRIQDFYISNTSQLDTSIEKIHIEFGRSLTDLDFVSTLRDCFLAGLSLTNSAVISAIVTINYNIFKSNHPFSDLLDDDFFEFFHLFNHLFSKQIPVSHAVIITSVVKRPVSKFTNDQFSMIEKILVSTNETKLLKSIQFEDSNLFEIFIAKLDRLDLPPNLVQLIKNSHTPDAKLMYPLINFINVISVLGICAIITIFIEIYTRIVSAVGISSLITFLVLSAKSPPFIIVFQGLVLASVFSAIPLLAAKFTKARGRVYQSVAEIVLFTTTTIGIGYILFGFKGNNRWILYALAIVLFLEIGANLIDFIRGSIFHRIDKTQQYKVLRKDAVSFDVMFNYEKILYAALPLGIVLGALIGAFQNTTQTEVTLLSIRAIALSAFLILVFFTIKSLRQMIVPMYRLTNLFNQAPVFTSSQREDNREKEEKIISLAFMSTELRKLYLFDSAHNILLMFLFSYTFIMTYGAAIEFKYLILFLIATNILFSQFPYVLGQYLLHQQALEQFEGIPRVDVDEKLNKYAPLYPTFPFLAALLTSGTAGGLAFYLLDNFIKGLFK